MEHRAHLPVERAQAELAQEFLFVQIVRDAAIDDVAEFVALREIVDRDDVVFTTLVERPDQVGTDESCRAGDHDHEQTLSSNASLSGTGEQLFGMHHGRAELADYDACGFVRPVYGLVDTAA